MISRSSIPNMLGLFRILATPLLMWLILRNHWQSYLLAAGLLGVMALTDLADGHLARRLQVVSPLGVFLDTISDKICTVGTLLPLVQLGLISGWIALVILVREFVVSGLRSYAASEGVVIAAGIWGKQKFAITIIAMIWLLLAASGERGGMQITWEAGGVGLMLSLWTIPMALAVLWTVFSGVEYLWKAWPLLRKGWAPRPKAAADAAAEG